VVICFWLNFLDFGYLDVGDGIGRKVSALMKSEREGFCGGEGDETRYGAVTDWSQRDLSSSSTNPRRIRGVGGAIR
jgi:hypothetical protein